MNLIFSFKGEKLYMNVHKQIVGTLDKCYALSTLPLGGETCLLVAAEKHDACLLLDGAGHILERVMDEPGGVMTMVPVPGRDGVFFTTHGFYSPNDAAQARLDCVEKTADGWRVTTVAQLPFVHRFDLLPVGDVTYVLACTLKSGHEYKDDWRSPGKLWTGVLGEDPAAPLALTEYRAGLGHNHGYTRYTDGQGKLSGIVSCDEGVFRVSPPDAPGAAWRMERLLDLPCSDAVLLDLDGDGRPELLTLSPFHGDSLAIWHLRGESYELVYEHPEKLPFLHAICAGEPCGRPAVFVGCRGGERRLLVFRWSAVAGYFCEELDRGAGAANCMLFERDGHPALLAANRECDEIAVYDLL